MNDRKIGKKMSKFEATRFMSDVGSKEYMNRDNKEIVYERKRRDERIRNYETTVHDKVG